MAIYTRFGSKVTIIGVLQDNQNTWLKVQLEDGTTREWAAYEFRADGGWTEIKTAMDALGKPVNVCAFETGLNYGCEQAPAASEPTPETAAVEPDAYHRLAIAMGVAPEDDDSDSAEYCEQCGDGVYYELHNGMCHECAAKEAPRTVDLLKDFDETPEDDAETKIWYCNKCHIPLVCWDGDEIWRCPECDCSEDEKEPRTIGYRAIKPLPSTDMDTLRAENARLRAALERIARNRDTYEDITKVAREALNAK